MNKRFAEFGLVSLCRFRRNRPTFDFGEIGYFRFRRSRRSFDFGEVGVVSISEKSIGVVSLRDQTRAGLERFLAHGRRGIDGLREDEHGFR